jgi:hypothetical protein
MYTRGVFEGKLAVAGDRKGVSELVLARTGRIVEK